MRWQNSLLNRSEVRRDRKNPPAASSIAVHDVILYLEVQLVDRCLEERRRREHRTDHIGAVAANHFRVPGASVLLLQPARQFGQVPCRLQVMPVQARRDLSGRRPLIRLRRYGNRRFPA